VTRAGATVIPAAPGFYHQPTTIRELVDFMVARVLDHLDLDHTVGVRWGDAPATD
jgi:4-hydroxy-3-polyprenylbenzoate decarboxylase